MSPAFFVSDFSYALRKCINILCPSNFIRLFFVKGLKNTCIDWKFLISTKVLGNTTLWISLLKL